MKSFNLINGQDDSEEFLAETHAKRIEFIHSLNAQELVDRLQNIHDSTDVLIEGYSFSDSITTADAVAYASVARLREVITECVDWIKNEYKLLEYSEDYETDL
jgi:3-dehydroquinate dehydratase